MLNVKDFGAIGDGFANDTPAIQAALDALGNAHRGALYIPRGTYLVEAQPEQHCLTLQTSNVRVFGDGPSSVLKLKDATPVATILAVQSSDPSTSQITNVEIADLALDGNKAAQSGGHEMKNLRIIPSDVVDIPANIVVRNVWSYGAYANDADVAEGGGISIEGSDHALPDVTTLDYPPQNILITGCFCFDNQGWGIGTNWGNGITLIGNVTYGNETMGITLWNTQDSVVSGNQSYGNDVFALNVEASDRIIVSGNRLRGKVTGAVKVYNSLDITLDGNDVTQESAYWEYHAVEIASGPGYGEYEFKQRASQRVRVTNNRIVQTGGDGYAVHCSPPHASTPSQYNTDILVEGNEIRNEDKAEKAILLDGLRLRVVGNQRIVGATNLNGHDDEVQFDGNTATASFGSTYDLVLISAGTVVSASRNLLICGSNTNAAIRVSAATVTRLYATDNAIEGAATYGIYVDTASISPIVTGTTVSGGVTYYCTSTTYPPTAGSWARGDVVWSPWPAAGGAFGWACVTGGTPGTWAPVAVAPGVSSDRGDASVTVVAGVDEPTQYFNTPLTANRVVTASTTGAWNGAKFRVVRSSVATGASTLTAFGKALTAGKWVDGEYNGSAWIETAYGSL